MFGGGIVRSGFRWCVSPPNWVWRAISCCPWTFCPAKGVLAGYLVLSLDILPRQKGFGGLSLRREDQSAYKKSCIITRNPVLVMMQPLFMLQSPTDYSALNRPHPPCDICHSDYFKRLSISFSMSTSSSSILFSFNAFVIR